MKRQIAMISCLLLLPYPVSATETQTKITKLLTQTSQRCKLQPADPENGIYSDPQLQTIAKQITVRVRDKERGASGTIFARKDNSYLVVTNSHVVRRINNINIITADGQKYAGKILPNTNFDKFDLAIVEFTSNQKYCLPSEIADRIASFDINLETQVMAAGYAVSEDKLVLTTGKIQQIISQPSLKDGYEIGYTSDIQPGMSGGAIISNTGNLIGINGISSYPLSNSAYVYTNGNRPTNTEIQQLRKLSWGIPIKTVLAQVKPEILTAYNLPIPDIKQQIAEVPLTGWLGELEAKARQITVRIDSSSGANGSGVIIAKQGDIYTVLTAAHVVCKPPDKVGPCEPNTYKILTVDGEPYPVEPSTIKLEEGVDLAVVKFTSRENYQVATLANYPIQDYEYMFTAGYPRLGEKSPWRFTLGQIYSKEQGLFQTTQSDFNNNSSGTAQSAASLTGGYELVYSSITFGGMSGGPVLDSQGRVIGIHGRTEGEAAIDNNSSSKETIQLGNSLGIPVSTFLALATRLNTQAQKVETTPPPELNQQEVKSIQTAILSVDVSQGNTTASQWLERGNQLWRLRRYPEAIQAFDAAIKQKPKFIHLAYYGKGLALAMSGEYPEAITALQQAVQSQPDFVPAWNNLSLVYRESNQLDKALAAINQAIQLQPNNPNLYNQKRGVLSDLKRYKEAAAAINKAIELSPRAAFYTNRGIVRDDLGDKQGAIDDYTLAIKFNPNLAQAYNNRGIVRNELGDKQGAIDDYTQAIKINPNYASAYNNRGNVRKDLGDKPGAIDDYNQAIKINPNDAEAYYNRGIVRNELGDKQGAIDDYNQAIKINPNYASAYNNRGIVRNELGDKPGAIDDYNQAIKINPNDAEAYYNRGIVRNELGDKQGAIDDYNQAIKINPNDAEAYYNRGNARYKLGDKQGAIDDYNQAIKINPNDAEAYYNRGIVRNELGDKPGEIDDYNQAIKINPNDAEAYYNRGIVRNELGDKQGAIDDFNLALKINPNNADAYISRGIIYHKQGNYTAAISDYNQAVAKNANSLAAVNNIGLIKYEQGDKETAIKQWQQAMKINNQFSEPMLALAVALYGKGEEQQAYQLAETALKLDKNFADVNFLKKNLWGDKIIADTQKLLSTPKMKTLLSQLR
ncbi:MAG: tetratricopeptide repeat protein [Dolichospermum sp. DET50]|nr:tetratricopeptide repeat protein [Dolichospermum sp. DET66]MBS3031984.1 tetratricopeptide repeat protein [Dolichospermum sp. DET67]MBS3037194.1 tetratricopeptide repeat protein [Dolichospermum sp. DET50]QSX69187.1 MAG: tetratricopeptide repeat protein [Dolichospermum sp. DET69]